MTVRFLKLRVEQVEMPGGNLAVREIVEHPGGVGIVAVTDEDEIILVKQFRKTCRKRQYMRCLQGSWIIMRTIEHAEFVSLAKRPVTVLKILIILDLCIHPRFADEVTHLYLATGLTKGENHLDPDEYLDVEFIPIDDVKKNDYG